MVSLYAKFEENYPYIIAYGFLKCVQDSEWLAAQLYANKWYCKCIIHVIRSSVRVDRAIWNYKIIFIIFCVIIRQILCFIS